MKKEYHLWLDYEMGCNEQRLFHHDNIYINSLAEWLIYHDKNIIYTTLPCTLTTDLFERGYEVFIHDYYGNNVEIKLGKNECTSREIKLGHNLEKLLLAGEFCNMKMEEK